MNKLKNVKYLNLQDETHQEFLQALKSRETYIQVYFNALNRKDLALYQKFTHRENLVSSKDSQAIILLGGVGARGSAYISAKKHNKKVFVVLAQDTLSEYQNIKDCFDPNDFIKVTSFLNLLSIHRHLEYNPVLEALDSYYMHNIKTDIMFENADRYINQYYAGRAIHKLIQGVEDEELINILNGEIPDIQLKEYYDEVENYARYDITYHGMKFDDTIDMAEWAQLECGTLFNFYAYPYPHCIAMLSNPEDAFNHSDEYNAILGVIDVEMAKFNLECDKDDINMRRYMIEVKLKSRNQ